MACTDEKQAAINFAEVFCNLLDKHRDLLAVYLADDAVLDWFGRTISGKDSIVGFMKLEVPETVHSLTSIEPSGPIQHRKKIPVEPMDGENNATPSKDQKLLDDTLSDKYLVPLDYQDYKVEVTCSKEDDVMSKINLSRLSIEGSSIEECKPLEPWQSQFTTSMNCEIPIASEQYNSAKYEEGQGDCLPKTSMNSFTKANRYLEARGSIQFQRIKQPKMAPKNMKLVSDTMKWGRFCKLQIAYSTPSTEFHKNDRCDGIAGEFKIWLLVYQDNTRCRRNLSEAFDQVK